MLVLLSGVLMDRSLVTVPLHLSGKVHSYGSVSAYPVRRLRDGEGGVPLAGGEYLRGVLREVGPGVKRAGGGEVNLFIPPYL